MFGWLKESRRIGTRHDKLARNFPPWLRWLARCGAYDSTFRSKPKAPGFAGGYLLFATLREAGEN